MNSSISCRFMRIVVLGVFVASFYAAASATTIVSTISVGAGPVRIALSPSMSRAFVSNRDSNSVSVVDTTSHTVIATVPVQGAPHGIAVRPDGSEIWVANRSSGTLSIIDANSLTVVGLINVGGLPDAVVFSHDGARAYVTNDITFSVAIINVATRTFTGFIATTSVPEFLLITPDDLVGYLAVVEPNGSNFRTQVVDLTTLAVTEEIQDTWLALFNQRGPSAWGFHPNNSTISLVHLGRLEIRTNIALSPRPQAIALSVDGKRIYVVCDLSNEMRVFGAVSGQPLEILSVGGRPTDVVVLPGGTTAYVAQLDANSLAVLSL